MEKMTKTNNRLTLPYLVPMVEVVEVAVEWGFAPSYEEDDDEIEIS